MLSGLVYPCLTLVRIQVSDSANLWNFSTILAQNKMFDQVFVCLECQKSDTGIWGELEIDVTKIVGNM